MKAPNSNPTYLYFHGGPGLSSIPDQALLKRMTQDLHLEFWNEPSNLRPKVSDPFEADQAFRNWMGSAENFVLSHWMKESGPLFLVAHSFASLPLLQIAKRHEKKIEGVMLVSPVLDMARTFSSVLARAQRDLAQAESPVVQDLVNNIEASKSPFDGPMIQALEYALADSDLLLHYWKDQDVMADWQSVLVSDSQAGIDLRAWKAVLQDLYWENPYLHMEALDIPVAVISGMEDHFADRFNIERFLGMNPQGRYESWARCGHYPHLEDGEEFARSLYGLFRRSQLKAS